MKTFQQFLTEQAPQPKAHALPTGAKITIKKQADGTVWCDSTIVSITPTEHADVYNLALADKNTAMAVITPDQTTAIKAGQEVVLTYQGNEFVIGGYNGMHKATE